MILLVIIDLDEKLLLKFKSGLQEELYQKLKYMDISTIDSTYNQAQLANENIPDKRWPQQHSSYFKKHNNVPIKSPSPAATRNVASYSPSSFFDDNKNG